jgi:hypothetical protein
MPTPTPTEASMEEAEVVEAEASMEEAQSLCLMRYY